MATRQVIDGLWDRSNLNGVNDNFKFLFDDILTTKTDVNDLLSDYRESKINTKNNISFLFNNLSEVKKISEKASDVLNKVGDLQSSTDDTNKRLDKIIASSGTSDTEVVDARGEYDVLSERLLDSDKKRQYELKKANERNYLDFHFQNSSQTSNNTVKVNSDRDLTVSINISTKDKFELKFAKNVNDDFIKFKDMNYIGKITSSDAQTVTDNFNQSMVVSGSVTGSSDNWYATEIGTKLQYNFTGSSITFRYLADTRGGVWKASIDGNFIKNISTNSGAYSSSSSLGAGVMETNIANNLDNKEHTLVLEFIGQDKEYPTSTPRGWIRMVTSSSKPEYSFDTFVYVVKGATVTKTQNALWDSNKEFAFQVDFGDRKEWVPEHNSTGTLKLGNKGIQQLFIDNEEYSISQVLSDTSFTELKLLQHLFATHPTTGVEFAEFIITTTITSRGVKFNTKVEWLKETTIGSGYINMFTVNPKFVTDIITSYDTKYTTQIFDNSYQYLQDEAPYSYIGVSNFYSDIYLICHNSNPYETLRMAYSDRDGDEYGKGLFALQHRNEDLQKLYPRTYTNHAVNVGEIYQFEGYFGFGKLPMVNKLLG